MRALLRIFVAVLLGLGLTVPSLHAQEQNSKNYSGEIEPSVRFITVDGDEKRFREHQWVEDTVSGGVENFILNYDLGDGLTFSADGRAILLEDDYRIRMRIDKQNLGYLRMGYTEFRKYFDDTGGFFRPFPVQAFSLDRDLHLDIGNVFIEAGLVRAEWPRIVLGYEHKFRDGEKSLLEWGPVQDIDRRIFPSFKDVDEKLHVVRLDIDHDIGKVHLGNRLRYEHFDLNTTRVDGGLDLGANAVDTVRISDDYKHNAVLNTFMADSHVTDKVYLSLGYLFATQDGDASLRIRPDDAPQILFVNPVNTQSIDVDQNSHVVNLNAMVGPFNKLTFYGGIQGETTETTGNTIAAVDGAAGANRFIVSDQDKIALEERLGVRYTGLPCTTLFAEGQWAQWDVGHFERQLENGAVDLLRDTDTFVNRQRYTIGFNTSPFRRMTFSGRYRYNIRDNDYDHLTVLNPNEYPAFILNQDFTNHELSAKLTVRPTSRIQSSLQYQMVISDIDTRARTEPSLEIRSGNYDAHIVSWSVTVTPINRLYFTGLLSYENARTKTFYDPAPEVVAFDNDVFSTILSATYAIDEKTDVSTEYIFSYSDNFKDNSENGLPLGVDHERHGLGATLSRQLSKNILAKLRYGFYHYDEDSSGGVNDYTAHLIGASAVFKF
jgi:hypothetical protein